MNKIIFKCQFGSHLYGTNTPTSDKDYKSVFLPDGQDIVMQRAKSTLTNTTKLVEGTKNTQDDVDHESFSVAQFFKLLLQGQTAQIEMLFAPQNMIITQTEEWNEILKHRDHFLHKGTSAFVGYTRQQASKYGVKGFRVAALRATLDYLNFTLSTFCEGNGHTRLNEIGVGGIRDWISGTDSDQISLVDVTDKKGNTETYLEVCNRKVPLNATIKYAIDVFQKLFDVYGARALAAEKNEGIDWKALSHAVRVANQSIELLNTGKLTLPRPDRELLLAIKQGKMPYKEVEQLIERGLHEVDKAQILSKLPAKPNADFADALIEHLHLGSLQHYYGFDLGE